MNVLDLFSGIGGFSIGLECVGFKTIGFCEIDPYCRKILAQHWPKVPCHDDIKTFKPERRSADVICGGYPCQGESLAGRRRGEKDKRWLWPEMFRVIRSVRPRWVIAENVVGHISLNFDQVATSLEAEGFTVWPFVIPACGVGALHRRDRVWILANAKGNRRHGSIFASERKEISGLVGSSKNVADANSEPPQWIAEPRLQRDPWIVEPPVGRVVDGLSGRMDRIKALGNAIVPQIAQIIGQAIMEYENDGP